MTPMIQAAEVWTPDAGGQYLVHADGLYGQATEFGAVSRRLRFARGEGLPGRVWDAGRPILLKNLQNGFFKRAAAAQAAGLTCAVGIPMVASNQLRAVVVLFCGADDWGRAAIELWRVRPTGCSLVDGYYGSTPDSFRAASRSARIEVGKGLPMLVSQQRGAVFAPDLSDASRFVGSRAAAESGLRYGFAIPWQAATGDAFVLTFLSSEHTPIARRLEAWGDWRSDGLLSRTFGYCGVGGRLAEGGVPVNGEPTIRMALATAAPQVLRRDHDDPGVLGDDASIADAQGMMAFPVPRPGGTAEALVLYV